MSEEKEEINENKTENTNTTNTVDNTTTTNTTTTETEESTKNRFTMLILCWFLGLFGVHRLYAGKIGSGFLMLYGTIVSLIVLLLDTALGEIFFIVMGTFVLNDFACIACRQFKDVYGKYVVSDKIN